MNVIIMGKTHTKEKKKKKTNKRTHTHTLSLSLSKFKSEIISPVSAQNYNNLF